MYVEAIASQTWNTFLTHSVHGSCSHCAKIQQITMGKKGCFATSAV